MRALLLTLLTGIFFLIGIFINKLFKSNKLVETFSIGMSFIVLFNIIFFDIVPEIKEFFDFKYFLIVILGFSLLKILDFFVPDHNHHHKEKLLIENMDITTVTGKVNIPINLNIDNYEHSIDTVKRVNKNIKYIAKVTYNYFKDIDQGINDGANYKAKFNIDNVRECK